MVWQDVLIAIANIVFSYSLLIQVIHGFKKKKALLSTQASILTTIGLYAMTYAFLTLNLYFSTIICFLNGSLWFILFFQSVYYPK